MFDIGFTELALILVLGLLVLGPERLPRVARTIGMYLRKARQTWYSVKNEVERELAAEDMKKTLLNPEELTKPFQELKDELNKTLDLDPKTDPKSSDKED